ncbi:hypothetical protein T4D_3383 [Trichinella pseudospiralis]|uniref:Uncharacterized protein n=1 Tax=Trichinella pseudospiralis TaxID=6337 RepID=A0A0V1FR68_TRIPS|nr:hypothetical protein T4D_3383 [Trichinella pseudospiralis]
MERKQALLTGSVIDVFVGCIVESALERKLMKLCLELKRLARKDMLVCVALTNRLFKKKQPFSCTVAERNSVALLTPDSLLLRFSVLLLRMVHVRISLAKCCFGENMSKYQYINVISRTLKKEAAAVRRLLPVLMITGKVE